MGTTERVNQYIEYKGISKYKFCKDLGFSNKFLDNSSNMGTDKACIILRHYPEISPEWLLTGQGSMLKSEVAELIAVKNNHKGIPVLPFDAFAGIGDSSITGVDFDTIEERYEIPLFDGLHIDFMIPVRGSSMYPKYSSGDVVACRLIDELLFVQWNKVYVIDSISQGIMMKRLKKSNHDDCMICKSDNIDYDEFEIPKSDIRKIALVVGVIRQE